MSLIEPVARGKNDGNLGAPFDYRLPVLYISNSTIHLFRNCPAKFEYRKLFRHGLKERSIHTDTGNAVHRAYQQYLIHRDEELALWELMQAYPYDLQDNWTDRKGLYSCYAVMEELFHSQNLYEYELVYIKDSAGNPRPAVEVPFIIRLNGLYLDPENTIPIVYRGKIDAILFNNATQQYLTTDIKTHSDKRNDLTMKYMFDEQPITYGIVLQQLLGEAIDNFEISFISCYMDFEKPKVWPYKFVKQTNEIQSWARGLRIDIELMRMYYQMRWFRRDSSACMGYGYGSVCQFADNCAVEDRATKQKLITIERDENQLYHDTEANYFGEALIELELDLDV